jgi:hypothetical protein
VLWEFCLLFRVYDTKLQANVKQSRVLIIEKRGRELKKWRNLQNPQDLCGLLSERRLSQ